MTKPADTATSPEETSLEYKLAVCAVLALLTGAIYWNALSYPFFIIDDAQYVFDNPYTSQGLTLDGIVYAFERPHLSNYHPITMLSLMLDTTLFGKDAPGYHRTNILFHLANAILLYLVLLSLTKMHWRSALVAALFVSHPLLVEPVVWITSRKDVLSTFFWLLTMAAYIRYVRTSSIKMYVAMCALFTAGMLSKTMLVTLPFVLLMMDFWPLRRDEPGEGAERPTLLKVVAEKIPLLGVGVAVSAMTVLGQSQKAMRDLNEVPLLDRLGNMPISYMSYIRQTFVPSGFEAGGYLTPSGVDWRLSIPCLVILTLVSAAAVWRIRDRFLFVSWFWFIGTLVPVIGIVSLGTTIRADRYMYVPVIGLLIFAVWAFAEYFPRLETRRNQILGALAGVMIVVFAGIATIQAALWRDSITVLENSLATNPRNLFALAAVAKAYNAEGDYEASIEKHVELLKIMPNAHDDLAGLGIAWFNYGNVEQADLVFKNGREVAPENIKILVGQAHVFLYTGRIDQAAEAIERAQSISPDNLEVRRITALLEQMRARQ